MGRGWLGIRLQDVRSLFRDGEGLGRDQVTRRQVTIWIIGEILGKSHIAMFMLALRFIFKDYYSVRPRSTSPRST